MAVCHLRHKCNQQELHKVPRFLCHKVNPDYRTVNPDCHKVNLHHHMVNPNRLKFQFDRMCTAKRFKAKCEVCSKAKYHQA